MTALGRTNQIEPHSSDPHSSGGEQHRRNPLQVIWLRRWIVIVTMLIALALGAVNFYRATPLYRSTARVYVTQSGPKLVGADMATVMTATNNYLWTQCELICSPHVLEEVAKNKASLKTFQTDPAAAASVVGYLRSHVSAMPGRRDDIISIFVKAPQPEDAAILANAIVDEYEKFVVKENKSTAATNREMIEKAKSAIDEQLEKELKARKEFQQTHSQYSLGQERTNAIIERLNQLSGARTQAQLDVLRADSLYNATKAMMDDPEKIRQLMSSPNLRAGDNAQLRYKLRDLQEQLAQLSTVYLPGSTSLNAAQNQIKRLQSELDEADRRDAEAYLADLATKRDAAKTQETQITQYLQDQREEVLKLNSAQAEFDAIEARVRGLEREKESREDQLKALNIAMDVDRPMNIKRVEEATASFVPVEPDKASILFYSLIIGAIAGVTLAFAREYTDQRLRSVEEIKLAMSLPILGVVPHIVHARTPSQRGTQLHLDPMSDVAEAYRTIRTAIYFGNPHGVAKTLLITSPAPGDGKTTLASNLAIAMAQAGNRILLLDADFRKPVQHRIFDLQKKIGLSSVLAGDATLEEAIQNTPIEGLQVLPCGPIPANPSEILNSQSFADLLDELAGRFDHVLLDSPPVMPVTDARILAAGCDATVLALRAEKSTRKGAVYARDVLKSVGSRILGVVVNDVPRRKGVYGYYYSDAEVYSYGYAASAKTIAPSNQTKALPNAQPSPKETGLTA
jgi:capsular exopolysaccharide synthesis family protein